MRIVIFTIALLIMPTVLAGDLEPAFTASGSFLTGSVTHIVRDGRDPCDTPGWDGVLGSCLTLPEGLAGRNWTLQVDSATVPSPALGYGLTLCFVAPEASMCTSGGYGDGSTLHNMEGDGAVPSWTRHVVITANRPTFEVAWTFTVHPE